MARNKSKMSNDSLGTPPLDPAICTRYLRTFRWPELWQLVRHLNLTPGAQRSNGLALKAMLLVGWWQEEELAKPYLALFKGRVTDPLAHFALSYTALCLDDVPRYLTLHRDVPHQQPRWMQLWLELEVLGRSDKTIEQVKLLNRIVSVDKRLPKWSCIALLQSNDSVSRDISPLRNWLQGLPSELRQQSLLRALAARCGMVDAFDGVSEPVESMPAPLLYRYALYLLGERDLPQALRAFDILAHSLFVDLSALQTWLSLACSIPQGWNGMAERVQHAINLVPRSLIIQGTVSAYALITTWLRSDLECSEALVNRFFDYLKLPKSQLIKNTQVFFLYAAYLCNFRRKHSELYISPTGKKPATLVALGESHALSLANLHTPWAGQPCKALTAFVMGVKMFHLAELKSSYHGECVRLHLESFKRKPVHLLLTIGEIDCRPDEGIWPLHRKNGRSLDELITRTVAGYIDFLQQTLVDTRLLGVTIQGIPAPGYALVDDKDPGDIRGFVAMIRLVNNCLRKKTLAAGYRFLDVHSATVGDDGRGNGHWHLDGYHLSPAFYQQAQKWLLSPS